jgi:hypothetical protein
MGDRFEDVVQVRRAADLIELVSPLELLGQSDGVDAANPFFVQQVNRCVNAAMGVAVEVVGVQKLRDFVDRIVPQQDAAENAPFGVRFCGGSRSERSEAGRATDDMISSMKKPTESLPWA